MKKYRGWWFGSWDEPMTHPFRNIPWDEHADNVEEFLKTRSAENPLNSGLVLYFYEETEEDNG